MSSPRYHDLTLDAFRDGHSAGLRMAYTASGRRESVALRLPASGELGALASALRAAATRITRKAVPREDPGQLELPQAPFRNGSGFDSPA